MIARFFESGNGTEMFPYLIANADQLDTLADLVENEYELYGKAFYKVVNDFTTNEGFSGIGTLKNGFAGVFDGGIYDESGNLIDKHTITLDFKNIDLCGLFKTVGSAFQTEIKNLCIAAINCCERTKYSMSMGAVANEMFQGSIRNVTVLESVNIITTGTAGGILARSSYGSIIEDCISFASVTSTNDVAGGIVGSGPAIIRLSCNAGHVRGDRYAGGIVGYGESHLYYGTCITDSFNIGMISCNGRIGGIIGNKEHKSIVRTYHAGTCTGAEEYIVSGDHNYYLTENLTENTSDFNKAIPMTKEQFENGEVTHLLNEALGSHDVVWEQGTLQEFKSNLKSYPILAVYEEGLQDQDIIKMDVGKSFCIKVDDTPRYYSLWLIDMPDCVALKEAYRNKDNYNEFEYWFYTAKVGKGSIKFRRHNTSFYEEPKETDIVEYSVIVEHVKNLGSGTPEDPYIIRNAEDFEHIKLHPECSFKLEALIRLPKSYFDNVDYFTFKGTLDGNSNTIIIDGSAGKPLFHELTGTVKNIYISGEFDICKDSDSHDSYDQRYYSIFTEINNGTIDNCINTCIVKNKLGNIQYLSSFASINNGVISNSSLTWGTFSGGSSSGICIQNNGKIENCFSGSGLRDGKVLCGICIANTKNGTISNTYVEASLHGEKSSGAGICEYNSGTIKNCFCTGQLNMGVNVAGIAIYNLGKIDACYNSAEIFASKAFYAGGIASINSTGIIGDPWKSGYGIIENCYQTGTIKGSSCAGGICSNNTTKISNCYNIGSIESNMAGDIVGNNTGEVSNCYFNAETSYTHKAIGINRSLKSGGPKTSIEIKDIAFVDQLNNNSFVLIKHKDEYYAPELIAFARSSDARIKEYSEKSVVGKKSNAQ